MRGDYEDDKPYLFVVLVFCGRHFRRRGNAGSAVALSDPGCFIEGGGVGGWRHGKKDGGGDCKAVTSRPVPVLEEGGGIQRSPDVFAEG